MTGNELTSLIRRQCARWDVATFRAIAAAIRDIDPRLSQAAALMEEYAQERAEYYRKNYRSWKEG
jgi:hypothetical protein